ncbi:hypothetical protein ACX80H_04850 [Arthrobacter sp. MDT2-2]
MTMGTHGQRPSPPPTSTRDIILHALAGVALALAGVFSLLGATTWYLILGGFIMLAAGALFVARAITSLRTRYAHLARAFARS